MARRQPSQSKQPKRQSATPTRTREHHIADLSRNYFERFVLANGWTVEGKLYDYGYDLTLNIYDYKGDPEFRHGDIENGNISVQLKATDHLKTVQKEQLISFGVSAKHLHYWSGEIMPVILVLYDVQNDRAFWLYIQKYVESANFEMAQGQESVTLHIPVGNVLDANTIRLFREYKQVVFENIIRR